MSRDIRNDFILGRMNKSLDERLVPKGEYVDARNVRLGSTETTEIGAVENSKGNISLTDIRFQGESVSNAKCIGVYEDGVNQTLYWFVSSPTVDMILSYNTKTDILTYHVESTSVLSFNDKYLITGVDKIGDLLFFTDNINAPRVINVTKNYPSPIGGIDQITKDDVNVIKKIPGYEVTGSAYVPFAAPEITPQNQPGDENYMRTKFLSFAYRYRYEDGQYSAISLFSKPMFQPGPFRFSIDNYNNAGMENFYNSCNISFSTGTKRVLEVDVLYKDSDSNVIYVIDRYNKQDQGWPDNETKTISFTNAKIYTTLASDELLRLYDNVPRLAKAQTIQGNRLMYGNYTEGYNIERPKGTPLKIEYTTDSISTDVGGDSLPAPTESIAPVTYTINPTASVAGLIDGQITFDLSQVTVPIPVGTNFVFSLTFESSSSVSTVGSGPLFDPDYETNGGLGFNLSFQFTVESEYSSVNAMLNSIDFQNRIGTSDSNNFEPIATSTQGFTLVDQFNSYLSNPLGMSLVNTGITGNCGDPTVVGNCVQGGFGYSVSGSTFSIQSIAAQYYFDDGAGNISNQWEYFEFNGFSSNGGFTKVSDTSSLHSNRDYDTGIVYMDDYGRASTVLTSEDNTTFFSASDSIRKNQIQVTLQNLPPYWASKYKFVVKPNKGNYETVYVNNVYQSSDDKSIYYYKLEADNINKVKVGDTLTVKVDALGNVNSVVKANILDIATYSRGELELVDSATNLPGVYMTMKSGGFTSIDPDSETYDYGLRQSGQVDNDECSSDSIRTTYSLNKTNDILDANPIILPAGSTVRIYINNWRSNSGGANCNGKSYKFDETFLVTQDYPTFYDWMIGDNIDLSTGLGDGMNGAFLNNGGAGPYTWNGATVPAFPPFIPDPIPLYGLVTGININCFQSRFYVIQNASGGQYFVDAGALKACGAKIAGTKRYAHADMRIQITVGGGMLAFETEPAEVDPNLFYDASELYDISGGFHQSGNSQGDQNQTAGLPLVATLNFSDVYSFGNGIESYKIFDELASPSTKLGERVLAVSNQDYKRAHRFAEITYSGVFSPGSNSNNLNEFNLGLVNFQDYETSFGPIMKLHARETDILCLQEDRISYILTDKDVITDAGTGGGAIVAVPSVLGKQITRLEEYGISFNPESFASWGNKMFFTDTKRSAVLMLEGSGQGQSLTNISEMGMRAWFRDQFIEQFDTQKLGGYDPYMDEYVLSTNNEQIPSASSLTSCGVELSQADATGAFSYSVELGPSIGEIEIDFTVTSGEITVDAIWNGTTYTTTSSSSGTLSFDKTATNPSVVDVVITPTTETATYSSLVNCPPLNELTVIQIVLTTNATNGQFTHYGYRWTDGVIVSPTTDQQAELGLVSPSEYTTATGQQSVGVFPYDGTDITMRVNSKATDNYVFPFPNTNNPFKYLSSGTLYEEDDMNTLIPLLTNVPGPIVNASTGVYQSVISSVDLSGGQYLYLVWDLREVVSSTLCYEGSGSAADACCGCSIDCNPVYFGPASQDLALTCSTDTNSTGFIQGSFNGINNIPLIGDVCYSNTSCYGSQLLPEGYYVVDVASPAVASPKTWIKVGSYGLVIDNGTC